MRALAVITFLFTTILSVCVGLHIVAEGRQTEFGTSCFVVVDSQANLIGNYTSQTDFNRIGITEQGAWYCSSSSSVYVFEPDTFSFTTGPFNLGYPAPGLGVFGFSTEAQKLIFTVGGYNSVIYAQNPNSVLFDSFIKIAPPVYLANDYPFAYFDDESSLIFQELIAYTNNSRYWGVFDVKAQALITAYPFDTPFSQPCATPVWNRESSDPVFICSNFNAGLYEFHMATNEFKDLNVDLRAYFKSNAAYIQAATLDSSGSLWYGAVVVVDTYYLVTIDLNTLEITTLGALPSGIRYTTMALSE